MATDNEPWSFPRSLQPRPDEVEFDLDRALTSVVALRAAIPADAFTAPILGTERSGNGDASVQEELTVLVHLGAREQLHALLGAGYQCVLGWRSSLARFMKDAGCPVRAIDGGRRYEYELRGTWHPIPD